MSELAGNSGRDPGSARAGVELFLISFFVLFFELTCIRWFGSTVPFLTFFTNIVLMASFLGVSVGCLARARPWSWMTALVPLAIVATGSASGFLWVYERWARLLIDVGSQESPQLIYFGTDARVKDPSKWVLPIEFVAAYFFVLIALLFIGPGQEMGRRFARIGNRMLAYSLDIMGSLTGIVVFGALSYLHVRAVAWFAIGLTIGACFIPRRQWLYALGGAAVLALVFISDLPRDAYGAWTEVTWSPYYQVRFKPAYHSIDVNNLGHQVMIRGPGYFLPHLLNRDSGGKPFRDVLVIGAGSGNDVAAALTMGAERVDAVEIDPVIIDLGRLHHPYHPYSNPRVTIHNDDGRGFTQRTNSRYDLISYALVDSLVLHSSYSSVRLESFLFTEQAFRDVKAKLKPGGVFALYNLYRQGWVVGRLVSLAEAVFGTRPIIVSVPYRETISPQDSQRDQVTFILVGDETCDVIRSIRTTFAKRGYFWINRQGVLDDRLHGFSPAPLATGNDTAQQLLKVGPATVNLVNNDVMPTDDWPFLYLRAPLIPALNLRGMAIVAVLSVAILFLFAPVRRLRPNGQMFFLGAGFMLLETKGVVHMALLFGATWMVNSIVFAAILTMILASNLYVVAARPRRLWPFYLLLLVALLANCVIPMDWFLALPEPYKAIGSCTIVFLPVLFAGVVFATTFRSSTQPDVDFGSNVAGIILGGLSEYCSLIVGFQNLIWIAIGYYLLSALLRPKALPAVAQ
jgi:SAM-dependent methyltransferase